MLACIVLRAERIVVVRHRILLGVSDGLYTHGAEDCSLRIMRLLEGYEASRRDMRLRSEGYETALEGYQTVFVASQTALMDREIAPFLRLGYCFDMMGV